MNEEQVKIKFNAFWDEIHDFAATCNTIAERNAFKYWIDNVSRRFFCDKCRPHFIEYVKRNPVEKSEDPVIWANTFHNAVNRRLGKPELSVNQGRIARFERPKCESCEI